MKKLTQPELKLISEWYAYHNEADLPVNEDGTIEITMGAEEYWNLAAFNPEKARALGIPYSAKVRADDAWDLIPLRFFGTLTIHPDDSVTWKPDYQ